MDMTMRIMTPDERKYTYTQSSQLISQTGCIGHLRADMDTDGNGFFSSWDNHRGDLKTDEFKAEFDEVINALRFSEDYGPILKNRSALTNYCYSHMESSYGGDNREFGVRVDTAQYAYLLRLNPNKGEYNLYCYCYRRDWLDRHMKNAEKGIRFITPDYKEKFRLPDGDMIRIITEAGENRDREVRYIDDCHLEVSSGLGCNLYHICEFAENLERNGCTVIPLRSSLPDKCYGLIGSTGEPIIIKKGEMGHYKMDVSMGSKEDNQALVDEYNRKLGVSKAQAAAMSAGSLFGWHVPAADPKCYDENGNLLKNKHRDRGDAR